MSERETTGRAGRQDRKPSRDEPTEEIAGLVYGVRARGRLPASFRPYLQPIGEDDRGADALELRYRLTDELPQSGDELWAEGTEEDSGPAGGRFALLRSSGDRPDGDFDLLVSDRGRGLFRCGRRDVEIDWTPGGTAAPHYFFSYALPLWLESRGAPVLHGGVASLGDRAVGFIGRSGVGKSVLVAELARLGCGLVADDGLVLRRGGGAAGRWRAFHGPPLLRLWPSALARLGLAAETLPRVHPGVDKRLVRPDDAEWLRDQKSPRRASAAARGLPLAALYLLERRPAGPGAARSETAVSITACSARQALVHLLEHGVAGAPATALGLSGRRLELLADVAGRVPMRRLLFADGGGSAERILEAVRRDLAG